MANFHIACITDATHEWSNVCRHRLVAGGSDGGIAECFGKQGANVVVNSRSSEERAQKVVEEIEAAGGRALGVQADVTVQYVVTDA